MEADEALFEEALIIFVQKYEYLYSKSAGGYSNSMSLTSQSV